MSWLSRLTGGGAAPASDAARQAAAARSAEWERALARSQLPAFVRSRLEEAGAGRTPWISTMTPSELRLARSHGLRPIATVSGTICFQFGYSWTEGHATGWGSAVDRIRAEAVACGANAVVDVKMRTARVGLAQSMDFTLVGTAVRLEGLEPSLAPVIATVPALEFVRLLEAGITPVGLAVGACYDWLTDLGKTYAQGGYMNFSNQPLNTLGNFWERIRRTAHARLREDVARQGAGVLAHTQFGEILKQEGGENMPDRYLGRHIVIGTVVDTRPGEGVPHDIRTVVDMRDDLSPLNRSWSRDRNAYDTNDREGDI
jgi:uncharacterized protein YbjQ (UPF0145 family)